MGPILLLLLLRAAIMPATDQSVAPQVFGVESALRDDLEAQDGEGDGEEHVEREVGGLGAPQVPHWRPEEKQSVREEHKRLPPDFVGQAAKGGTEIGGRADRYGLLGRERLR